MEVFIKHLEHEESAALNCPANYFSLEDDTWTEVYSYWPETRVCQFDYKIKGEKYGLEDSKGIVNKIVEIEKQLKDDEALVLQVRVLCQEPFTCQLKKGVVRALIGSFSAVRKDEIPTSLSRVIIEKDQTFHDFCKAIGKPDVDLNGLEFVGTPEYRKNGDVRKAYHYMSRALLYWEEAGLPISVSNLFLVGETAKRVSIKLDLAEIHQFGTNELSETTGKLPGDNEIIFPEV